jgi:type IV pili sensor histidine kinase/response regulator
MSRHSVLALLSVLLAGCAAQPPQETVTASAVPSATSAPQRIAQGRYTLVSTEPLPEQLDLLAQIVEIRIPATLTPTVGEALQHLLQRTGYHLCPEPDDGPTLYRHALPGAHYQLGPIPLKQALQLLGGRAWLLTVDDRERQVCFLPRPEPDTPQLRQSATAGVHP